MKEVTEYDSSTDTLIITKTYDREPVLNQNIIARNSAPEFGRYKGKFIKAASLDLGDVERLKNIGYNVLSPDQAELRRALVYIQQNEPWLLTLPGKPFAKKRVKWQ